MYSVSADQRKNLEKAFSKIGVELTSPTRLKELTRENIYLIDNDKTKNWGYEVDSVIMGFLHSIVELQEKNAALEQKIESLENTIKQLSGWTSSKEFQKSFSERVENLERIVVEGEPFKVGNYFEFRKTEKENKE